MDKRNALGAGASLPEVGPPGALAGANRAAEDKAGEQILEHSAPERQDDGGAFAQLQAQAALAGITVCRTAHGDFMVSRWSWSRTLPDLAAVEALLRQMGVRS